jgi:DNA-binding CsgD family transcriptional regulator
MRPPTVPTVLISRSGLSPVMVGRDEELAVLRRLLATPDQATGPEGPGVVMISGDAGVGKSRLLRESLLAAAPGTLILAGQADEGDLARPFELVRVALEPHAPLPAADAERNLDEQLRECVDAIIDLAGGARFVLAFEDLHWADAESVAVLGRLAMRADLDAVLIGTFRPEDFDRRNPLAALLSDLDRQRSVHHVELRGLSPDDLARMMQVVYGHAVSQRAVDALHRRTQGNPFFVEELLDPACCIDPEELATVPLPWNVAEAVLRKVDTLDDDQRAVLDAAAILGSRIPFDVLAAVAGFDERTLIRHLRALVASGQLVEDEADVFTFRHALTREAVGDAMLGREQRRLHERALDELRAAGSGDHAALARHALGARRFDEVVQLAREGAARYLRESSMAQALHLAEMGLAEEPDDRDLLEIASRAAFELAMVDVAERHADAWHRLAVKAGDVAGESAALRQLAIASWFKNDVPRYRALVEEALERAETLGPSVERCWAIAYKSQMEMLLRVATATRQPAAEIGAPIEWAERALAAIDEIGCEEIRPYVLVNLGTVLAETADREVEGLAMLREAWQGALARNDSVTIGRALNNWLSHLLFNGGPDDPLPILEQAEREAEARGLDVVKGKLHASWMQWALINGDLERAELEVQRGLRYGNDAHEFHSFTNMEGQLALERGDVARAQELLEQSSAMAETNEKQATWMRLLAVAVAAESGPDATSVALEALRATLAASGPDYYDQWGERESTAVLEAVRGGVAVHEIQSFFATTVPPELRTSEMHSAWLWHAEAALLEIAGDHASAVARYRDSLAAERPPRGAAWRSDAHLGLARCLLALGDDAAARAEATNALALLDRWPGRRRVRAEALVRRLTASGGPSEGGELTNRELEVVRLIGDGLTNRQIADELYISVRTAAVHVSNILAKTGAASRTEAAAWARRKGLLTDT